MYSDFLKSPFDGAFLILQNKKADELKSSALIIERMCIKNRIRKKQANSKANA